MAQLHDRQSTDQLVSIHNQEAKEAEELSRKEYLGKGEMSMLSQVWEWSQATRTHAPEPEPVHFLRCGVLVGFW